MYSSLPLETCTPSTADYTLSVWFVHDFQLQGIPKPDRDALDSARWMAYDAANEYLAEQRLERAPRRPNDPPPPSGKVLQRLRGFRHFRYYIQEHVAVVVGRNSSASSGFGGSVSCCYGFAVAGDHDKCGDVGGDDVDSDDV